MSDVLPSNLKAPIRIAVITIICVIIYIAMTALPAWDILHSKKGSKDHPSFHYAVQVAIEGGDPYDSKYLQERSPQHQ